MIHPRMTMSLERSDQQGDVEEVTETNGITNRAVCWNTSVSNSTITGWSALTIVDPTATLIERDSWSLTETLTAVIHSTKVSIITFRNYVEVIPAIEATVGNRIKPIHSLLIAGDKLSMESTNHSAVIPTNCKI